MRILNLLVCALMLLFIAAQYNDPDGPLWMVIYAVPALWAALAAFRPALLRRAPLQALLALCLLGAVALTAHYWPTMPDWWRQQVWWEQETAREGMGVMTVLAGLLVVLLTALRERSRGHDTTATP